MEATTVGADRFLNAGRLGGLGVQTSSHTDVIGEFTHCAACSLQRVQAILKIHIGRPPEWLKPLSQASGGGVSCDGDDKSPQSNRCPHPPQTSGLPSPRPMRGSLRGRWHPGQINSIPGHTLSSSSVFMGAPPVGRVSPPRRHHIKAGRPPCPSCLTRPVGCGVFGARVHRAACGEPAHRNRSVRPTTADFTNGSQLL